MTDHDDVHAPGAPPSADARLSPDAQLPPDARLLDELLGRLTLERKVRLLTGRDFWSTWPLEEVGLRSIVVSDGPSGVRGAVWDERDPSLSLPSASCLSASWDPAIAARYGEAIAVEAERKGVDVVLGPTINLHRSPLGGRHFESFSEDPRLTANLATAYVTAMQAQGIGACPKHYVANDYETERFTASTEVSERALRELYLLAFERPVADGGAWTVMSAYNRVNGERATEHELLETPLREEWGFDGVVVSDWNAVRTVDSARHEQDWVMPGPDGPWGDALVEAVRAGEVEEAAVDRKVRRMLLLAARVGALEGVDPVREEVQVDLDPVAFAREAAAEGTVLLRNEGLLPLDASSVTDLAVIGHNARDARFQGGGSATVLPASVVSPLEGLRTALPGVGVGFALGAIVQQGVAGIPLAELHDPVTDEPGVHVWFRDGDGEALFEENRRATELKYTGGDAPIGEAATVELRATWTPSSTGPLRLGAASTGELRLELDGEELLATELSIGDDTDPGAGFLHPPATSVPVEVEAGVAHDVRLEVTLGAAVGTIGTFAVTLGSEPDDRDPDALIEEAARLATDSDVAVVVVGTNSQVESEGHDRDSLALPGRQDELVWRVAATGTPTVVVVNAGSPVLMPWEHDVAAVLVSWFGGQQMGEALADVLLGVVEPGGRLPTTWGASEEDVPVLDVTPVDGQLHYDEGIHIGHRAWLRDGVAPAHWFGAGLGYTTWSLTQVEVLEHATPGSDARVALTVVNTGGRAGKQVVQLYLARPGSDVERPVRWLAAHAVVRAGPGETVQLEVSVPARAFAHWDDGWQWEQGAFELHVGWSAADLVAEARTTVG